MAELYILSPNLGSMETSQAARQNGKEWKDQEGPVYATWSQVRASKVMGERKAVIVQREADWY